MILDDILKKEFKSTLNQYHESLWRSTLSGEIDFIDRTVESFEKVNIHNRNQFLKTRSKKLHPKPKVRFYPFGRLFILNNATVEMGDLFFVYKHFLNGILNEHRAIVVQAKHTKASSKSWRIDTDQFRLLSKWPPFQFEKKAFQKLYHIRPRALTWATYGFVGLSATRYPLYCSSKRMLREIKSIPSSNTFTFKLLNSSGWDSSTSFLLKFIQGFAGENLRRNSRALDLVKDLYTVAEWEPDPPGDPKWETGKKGEEGFGIIEFTVTTERDEKRDS